MVATLGDPAYRIAREDRPPLNHPILVTTSHGKGRVTYLGSWETWRLRSFRADYYDRFWMNLIRHTAGQLPVRKTWRAARRSPEWAPEERQAIARGLEWLAKNQHRDGHWEGRGGGSAGALTGLAGTALLMEGSTLREGKYAKHLRRAVDWLVDHCEANGLIGAVRGDPVPRYMYAHGFGLLFLASVYGEEEDADRRKKFEDVLTRAVEFAGKAQTAPGGWGFVANDEGDIVAEPTATMVVLRGLLAARAAGIPVPKAVLDRGQGYLEKRVAAGTPLAPAAAALVQPENPALRKWLASARTDGPSLDSAMQIPPFKDRINLKGQERLDYYYKVGHDLMGRVLLLEQARLAYRLGEEGHAALLPDAKPEERLRWSEYRARAFPALLKAQQADGSWEDMVGPVQGTAVFLMILQMEGGALPAFQR
jgi:hypothetical protein